MQLHRITVVIGVTALGLLGCMAAFGAGGDEIEGRGMTTAGTGDTLIVNDPSGQTTVVLTGDTNS